MTNLSFFVSTGAPLRICRDGLMAIWFRVASHVGVNCKTNYIIYFKNWKNGTRHVPIYRGPGNLWNLWNLRIFSYATYKFFIWTSKIIILQVL